MNKNITKNWLIGFIEAEGTISSNKPQNKPVFEVTQHIADFKPGRRPGARGLRPRFLMEEKKLDTFLK